MEDLAADVEKRPDCRQMTDIDRCPDVRMDSDGKGEGPGCCFDEGPGAGTDLDARKGLPGCWKS